MEECRGQGGDIAIQEETTPWISYQLTYLFLIAKYEKQIAKHSA